MIQENIKSNIKKAMVEKNETKLNTYRSVLSAFINELVLIGKKPSEELNDENCIKVITRLAKQRKDSIEQFKKGGREDLVKNEEEELEILSEFLPEMMNKDEVLEFIKNKKEELKIIDPKEKGKLIGQVMGQLKGKADGFLVKNIVDELFENE